ncbi:single-stranded g-strand telomeric dna-binding protein [Stylonychia lemnae]|uniref:Single-stranded g-strand telomeric dna-binding protein n=1 Tax=Stylonychia lemnae TaxID=5949 RepID=A0A077ZQ21_STYLE|nr:single-stranded g-strand telomeric dna-binding protein [Stylonychia lemnae]|eukprot:CDW72032.1 single-stranded g-strand telomeric dna-binding protein [Stylonychia lemnae]
MEKEQLYNKSLDDLVQEDKRNFKIMSNTGGGGSSSFKRRSNSPKGDYDRGINRKGDAYRRRERSNSNGYKQRSNFGYQSNHQREVGTKVFVSNMSYQTDWRSLKDHMKKIGLVLRADVFEDERGKSRGIGGDAARAVKELHNSSLDGRVIFVREVFRLRTQSQRMSTESVETETVEIEIEICQEIKMLVGDKVRVEVVSLKEIADEDQGNLPYSVNPRQLKEAFQSFGRIADVDIAMDERGKSKGFGTISFYSRRSAEDAIKTMDQAKFNDRTVTVRFDRNY